MGNRSSTTKLRPEALGDLVDETNFTESELRHWFKEFRNDFPEGRLSIDQFREVYAQHFPDGDAAKFAAHVFRTFDHDHNHHLDFREFMCALSVTARGSPEERLHWAFRMYDIDENGYITKNECQEIIKAMYKMVATQSAEGADSGSLLEKADVLFTQMDANQDSRVSLEEFVSAARTNTSLMRLLQASTNTV